MIQAISALLRHVGRTKVKVGVGGALIQFHPTYHELLEAQLNTLAPLTIEVFFKEFVNFYSKSGNWYRPMKEASKERH